LGRAALQRRVNAAFLNPKPASAGATNEDPMPHELTWDNAEDIGIELSEKFPDQNPLDVRFTDLHRFVIELPNFTGDPKASNESKLEAIQMAWYEEFQDRNG
jgi:FeS assembly protein IscX